MSVRAIQRKHGVGFATVKSALESAWPQARKPLPPRASRLDPYKGRREIRIESGREPANAFIPQTHQPGTEAEVDFGEVTIRLAGELVASALFSFRLSYSGKAVHRISLSAGQEAFFEGHVHAFEVLGGVPTGKVRYDNLKAAVATVIGFSRQRVETERWTWRSDPL